MTNTAIIYSEQVRLQKEGKLKFTGEMLKGWNTATGEEVEFPEIQPIHTYQAWKRAGYQVKKGEKAIAKFPIWKFIMDKNTDGSDDEESGKMYMKVAAFFSDEQVEKIV